MRWNFWERQKNESDYSWQYREEPDYAGIKKLAIAVSLFTVVYCAHISQTVVGEIVDYGIGYMVNTSYDLSYIANYLAPYFPEGFDLASLKKVQTTITKPADPLLYMKKPVEGNITASFGRYVHPVLKQEMLHEGIDIQAPLGTGVHAAASGKVKLIADTAQRGKILLLEHSRETDTLYGHLGEVLVAQGEPVTQGQLIGRVGKTGLTATPLLYFEVREKGKAVDPMSHIKGESSAVTEGK